MGDSIVCIVAWCGRTNGVIRCLRDEAPTYDAGTHFKRAHLKCGDAERDHLQEQYEGCSGANTCEAVSSVALPWQHKRHHKPNPWLPSAAPHSTSRCNASSKHLADPQCISVRSIIHARTREQRDRAAHFRECGVHHRQAHNDRVVSLKGHSPGVDRALTRG